jgi:hypothetical protein
MRTLGWLKASPRAAGRLETKKAGALFAAFAEFKRGNDRQAFLYKNCPVQSVAGRGKDTRKARENHFEKNANEGEMLLERGT